MVHVCSMHIFTDGIIQKTPRQTQLGNGFSCRPAFGYESLGYVYGPDEDRFSRDLHKLLEAIPLVGIIFAIGRIVGALKSDCPASTKISHTVRGALACIPGVGLLMAIGDLFVTAVRELNGCSTML